MQNTMHRPQQQIAEWQRQRLYNVIVSHTASFNKPKLTGGRIQVDSKNIKVTSKWSWIESPTNYYSIFESIFCAPRTFDAPLFDLISPLRRVDESVIFTAESKGASPKTIVAVKGTVNEKKHYSLEVWQGNQRLMKAFDYSLLGHGEIVTKGPMQSFEWSNDGKRFLYIAKKAGPTLGPFITRKPVIGEEPCSTYRWHKNWGEEHELAFTTVVAIFELETRQINLIDKPQSSLGQAIFAPDDTGIVAVDLPNNPFRLEADTPNGRPQQLIYYDIGAATFTPLSWRGKYAFSPRFTPSGEFLLYLRTDVGGPYRTTCELCRIDWSTEGSEPQVLVPIPSKPGINDFPGIYAKRLIQGCITEDSKSIFINSIWHSNRVILKVDIDGPAEGPRRKLKVTPDDIYTDWKLLSIEQNYILAMRSAPHIRRHLVVGRVIGDRISWMWIEEPAPERDINQTVMKLSCEQEPQKYFEALHLFREVNDKAPVVIYLDKNRPCSNSIGGFRESSLFFLRNGYDVLMINYRGVLGYGQHNMDCLVKHLGDVDVRDIMQAVNKLRGKLSTRRFVVFGAGYGGFVAAHLAWKAPELTKALCFRNPIVDLSTIDTTDIFDYSWFGSLTETALDRVLLGNPPTAEDSLQLLEKSPIAYLHQIVQPCCFFVGKRDTRVDMNQGLRFFKHLREREIPTRCKVYDDDHYINAVKHKADMYISMIEWFDKFVIQTET